MTLELCSVPYSINAPTGKDVYIKVIETPGYTGPRDTITVYQTSERRFEVWSTKHTQIKPNEYISKDQILYVCNYRDVAIEFAFKHVLS